MVPTPCELCKSTRALIVRPKNHQKLCKSCFINIFETEIHNTITINSLFFPGERVAIGASGGKDSTVLASVLKTLNERYHYGLNLILLSIDEGIKGYRDDSLETVKRNAIQYDLPLEIVSYDELYGWTMDQVVEQIGKKGNCTYCGVFRRQALDRGAAHLGIKHVVTGHNADDTAETVMMNLLRGDLPRLARATSIVTASAASDIKRSKPLKYAYEKEIVYYALHKGLDYFTTECIYSPEAFRGSARTLLKNLEKVRPSAILDVVKSGEDMARLVPEEVSAAGQGGKGILVVEGEADGAGGCGSANGRSSGGEMADTERQLLESKKAQGNETEITHNGQKHDRNCKNSNRTPRKLPKQQMGKCVRCGYLSSQDICKACMLLESLNKNRPRTQIQVSVDEEDNGPTLTRRMEGLKVSPGEQM
jgi:cytoplasmic tRNA 2-thiolation protein 1